ncbi:MAG: hypothetical protein EZS28_032745, partial [Streblomastix strix]
MKEIELQLKQKDIEVLQEIEKQRLKLGQEPFFPYDLIIFEAGLKDQTLKILSQPITENYFHADVVDRAISMNDEADDIRLQRFIYKPTQPGGKKWLEDEDEICAIYGATLRAYSVLHGLLQAGVPGKRLLFIRPPADPDANSLNHERRIDAGEGGIKRKYKDGDDEIPKGASLKGDLAPFTPFDDPDTQIKVEKYLSEAGVRIVDGWNAISAHTELGEIPIGPDDEEYGIDTLMQIRQPKLKKKSWRRKFAKKKKK